MATIELYNGNCLTELQKIADNSIDSVVTDPPYELGFMGKAWDASGIAFNVNVWKECLRVLKPGGHILAFGGTRTYHRMTVAIEDAGFEIRDCIAWMYGSGFPKSHNIGKAIDKMQGNQRQVVGTKGLHSFKGTTMRNHYGDYNKSFDEINKLDKGNSVGEGWGTALKPAFEPVVMGRKPIEGTVANNVLTHGVGGLNIDASRIAPDENDNYNTLEDKVVDGLEPGVYTNYDQRGDDSKATTKTGYSEYRIVKNDIGRFPANVILDEEAGKVLDEQSGITKSGPSKPKTKYEGGVFGGGNGNKNYEGNEGGASRFFYCPKASKKDRDEGLDTFTAKPSTKQFNQGMEGKERSDGTIIKAPIEHKNIHPTVKPTALMEYLIKLVTPKGGKVLDPFMGSGSTGKGAVLNDYSFVGIELSPEYFKIAESRINAVKDKTKFWC